MRRFWIFCELMFACAVCFGYMVGARAQTTLTINGCSTYLIGCADNGVLTASTAAATTTTLAQPTSTTTVTPGSTTTTIAGVTTTTIGAAVNRCLLGAINLGGDATTPMAQFQKTAQLGSPSQLAYFEFSMDAIAALHSMSVAEYASGQNIRTMVLSTFGCPAPSDPVVAVASGATATLQFGPSSDPKFAQAGYPVANPGQAYYVTIYETDTWPNGNNTCSSTYCGFVFETQQP